jgi:hypothetical protein
VNSSVFRAIVTVAGLLVPGIAARLADARTRPAASALNDVMQAPFASDMRAAPIGAAVSPTWALDGKRRAFVSHRSSHSLTGVYDFVHQAIVRLSPSLDYDSSWP